MMADVLIRTDRMVGHITLNRPHALNALTHDIVRAVDAALRRWATDSAVALVVIDGAGDRAFCAGGDLAAIYRAGLAADHEANRAFFADEYRMNARIGSYPKPVIAFLHGFVMGGGVGIGGHASHRIVGESTRISMPEVSIGMVPDVGGTFILGHAPGRIGEYLGLTGARIGPGDAILAGFADFFVPEADWPAVKEALAAAGDPLVIPRHPRPEAQLEGRDLAAFGGETVQDILTALEASGGHEASQQLQRNSPLAMAAALHLIRAGRHDDHLRNSLAREFRFSYRSTVVGDFLEGIRALVIDKDRNPVWAGEYGPAQVAGMLASLESDELSWKDNG